MAAGLTVMEAILSVVDHLYVPPPEAVSVVLCPWQRVLVPVMATLGVGVTFTVAEAVLVQPFP